MKFLPGLLLVQVTAAALAVFAISGANAIGWALAGAVGATLTLVVGLWFGSIAEHLKKDALTDLRDRFARDRESLLVSAETEKRQIVEESHQRIVEETRRVHSKANFKLGAAVTGMVGIAGILLYIELFTLALVTATTAGGALAGYLARARQDGRALRGPSLKELADVSDISEGEFIDGRPSKHGGRSAKRLS
jgi:hypothetical protein